MDGHEEREVEQSVNFVTCHNGFTLNDLVSYGQKHNEANGEDNRDGANDNCSWNCGVEGPTEDPVGEKLRNQQVKNFLTVTAISFGMPMFPMGDEVRNSQFGNNNAYCQDSEISWLDWTNVEKHADVHRFVTLLNARRVLRDETNKRQRLSLNEIVRQADIVWHGIRVGQPDWGDNSHSLAFEATLRHAGLRVYLILNAYWDPLEFELPTTGNGDARSWRRWLDTSLPTPDDIVSWQEARPSTGPTYSAAARSVVVLFEQIK